MKQFMQLLEERFNNTWHHPKGVPHKLSKRSSGQKSINFVIIFIPSKSI